MKLSYLLLLSVVIKICLLLLPFMAVGQSFSPVPGLRAGELPNGFRYMLQESNRPANRVHFRLVMAVGSLQEETGEEGAAHFIEHLAFRKTKHFSNGKMVQELESLGGKYGVTINAYTGYDRTVYMFSVPAGDTRALHFGIRVVNEWLSNIVFDEKLVRAEKPIILEEIAENSTEDSFGRLKKGTNIRLHRFPIGSPEQVECITPKRLRGFYRRNYQPQNAILIIAGPKINNDETEQLIKDVFGHSRGNRSRVTGQQPLQYHRSENFETRVDNRRRKASVEWIIPVTAKPVLTIEDLIDDAMNNFVISVLNRHLRKKGSCMCVTKQWYLGGTEHLCFEVEAQTDTLLLEEFGKGIAIAEGIRKKGFTAEEVALQMKSFSERGCRFHRMSEQWCDYYTDMLLVGWRDAASEAENEALVKALSETTLDEWNEQVSRLLSPLSDHPLVGYRFNSEYQRELTFEDIVTVFRAAHDNPDTTRLLLPSIEVPAERTFVDAAFLNTTFKGLPDDIAGINEYPNLGVREVFLKNGARLILKPCRTADSTLSATLLFRGGLAKIPRDKYPFLESVAAYMSLGGIEGIDQDVYHEVLSNNALSIINTMECRWHGIMASGRSNDIRKLISLIHGRCFIPEKCYSAFEEICAEMKEEREKGNSSAMKHYIETSPERVMRKRIDELVGNACLPTNELATNEIERLDLDEISEYYRQIYTCSTGLTCIVTGNFDKDEAQECFTAMLSDYRPRTLIPDVYESRSHKVQPDAWEKVAKNSQSGRLAFHYLHRAEYAGGLRQTLMLKIMQNLLRNRVIAEIRNEAGLIYSPYVDLYYNAIPETNFSFDVNGTINAENVFLVKDKIDAIMQKMQSIPLSVSELEAIKCSFLMTKEEYLSPDAPENWKEYLASCVRENISLADANRYESILQGITSDDIQKMFRQITSVMQRVFLYTGDKSIKVKI